MGIGCDQCCKRIQAGEGCWLNEDEGGYYCSDACLTASFDGNPGRGNWREDEDMNAEGGYFSVLVDGSWMPLKLFWTTVPEDDECTTELVHCAICKGAIVEGRCLCEKEGDKGGLCDNPTCSNPAVEHIGDKQFCEGCMGAYLIMNSMQSEEEEET